MTPLRQRMIEDMRIRNFATTTQRSYIHYVAEFAKYFSRSPQELDLEAVVLAVVFHLLFGDGVAEQVLFVAGLFVNALEHWAPATTQLEDFLAGLGLQQVQNEVGLDRLRFFDRLAAGGKIGAGIEHVFFVEEQLVEIVRHIVVGRDTEPRVLTTSFRRTSLSMRLTAV